MLMMSSLLIAACGNDDPPFPDIHASDVTAGLFPSWKEDPALIVSGAAADGVTTLDVVVKVDASYAVRQITVGTGGEANGVILKEGEEMTYISETNPQGVLGGKRDRYFVYSYKVPSRLPAETEGSSYDFKIEVRVTDDHNVTVVQAVPVSLIRTPLLLAHGLASAASTFDPMVAVMRASGHYPECGIYALDYSATALSAYAENAAVIPDNIDLLKKQCLEAGYAVGKVNVVGHSMGGILARLYLQSPGYRDDIRAFIGIDVPHSGSQLADLGIDLANRYPSSLFGLFGMFGAIVDLQVGSEATASLNGSSLNAHTVPSHSICATLNAGDFVPELVAQKQYFQAIIVFLINDITDRLYGEENDLVVPLSSQQGGQTGDRLSTFANEWHCSVHTADTTAYRVMELLDSDPATNKAFAEGFAPRALSYTPGSILGVTVVPPGDPVKVGKGETRKVEVPGFGSMVHSLALLWNPTDHAFVDIYLGMMSADSFRISVPKDAPDQLMLHVLGKDAAGAAYVTYVTIDTAE